MKAIIKSIPAINPFKGMQVFYNNKIETVDLVLRTGIWLKGHTMRADHNKLQTLVAEINGISHLSGRQLLLVNSNWQQAVDNQLINNGKSVEIQMNDIEATLIGETKTYTKNDILMFLVDHGYENDPIYDLIDNDLK